MLENTKFRGYALSVRGASHECEGLPCQDSAKVCLSENLALAVLSDGHGSERHFRSAIGSEMAVNVAIRSVSDFAAQNGGIDRIFQNDRTTAARRIAANIICGWNSEIAEHIRENPLSESEKAVCEKYGGIANEVMYGATLIVAGISEKGCFGLQIGDGNFLVQKDGEIFCPMPDDAELVGNLTTSLCDNNAIESFRSFYSEGNFSGVSLSSDGLINSFVNVGDFMKFGKRIFSAIETDTADALEEHLRTRSRSGSRDDISVAAIYKDNY